MRKLIRVALTAACAAFFIATASASDRLITLEIPSEQYNTRQAEIKSLTISNERAISSGYSTLTEVIGLSAEEAKSFEARAQFIYDDRFNSGWEPVWYVELNEASSEDIYVVLVSYDGKHIGYATPGGDFTNSEKYREPISSGDDLINQDGIYFYGWSLEEKAEFSRKWIPIVEKYMEAHPYFTGAGGEPFFKATRYKYGLPGNEDITQEYAHDIAKQALIKLGATWEMIERRSQNTDVYFDVSAPQRPLWRFWFGSGIGNSYFEDDYRQFAVRIDARSGETVEAFERNKDHTDLDMM